MQRLTWEENDEIVFRTWIKETQLSPPKRISIADDTLKADVFYRTASEGSGYIWRGDFQNAKQLLQAVQRRIEQSPTTDFNRYRQDQAHKAQILSRLFICVESNFTINLPRAPDVRKALQEAVDYSGAFVISLRELLGIIGAHEWRKKGVYVPALGSTIHPHYGIFSPVRGEYLDLINKASLPPNIKIAFDIGTGTGVIAALLAKRGIPKIIATDLDPRALVCARENIKRLGFENQIQIQEADLFPEGMADLIVCNPPWIPARPTSRLERAIYDNGSMMLKGFLREIKKHLAANGEAWLILSDLAEFLGLRKPDETENWINQNGLYVVDQIGIRPTHGKATDMTNPLHHARAKETTFLWRLKMK